VDDAGEKTDTITVSYRLNNLDVPADQVPLIILNNQPTSLANLKQLNPNSILKVDILKGEKATRQYGVEGKNGVIIIATKAPAL